MSLKYVHHRLKHFRVLLMDFAGHHDLFHHHLAQDDIQGSDERRISLFDRQIDPFHSGRDWQSGVAHRDGRGVPDAADRVAEFTVE